MLSLGGKLARFVKFLELKSLHSEVVASKQPTRNGSWLMLTSGPWLGTIWVRAMGSGQSQAKGCVNNSAND